MEGLRGFFAIIFGITGVSPCGTILTVQWMERNIDKSVSNTNQD